MFREATQNLAARPNSRWLVAVLAAFWPVPAFAHGGLPSTGPSAWSDWHVTPDIAIATALVALVYGAGRMRRGAATASRDRWRDVLFFAGLATIFLALQSPLDPIAERLFSVHQIQHMLLRLLGPMLIALAWPQGVLTAGLPPGVRRTLLGPVASNQVARGVFGTVAHPVAATVLFIGVLYAWEIPRYHNLALADESVHYVMHATMLFAGLVFWWRVFDRRPVPQGARYGVRLMMLWLVILANIVLGAYTTIKTTVLYDDYDRLGRLFDYPALTDEQIGGAIIWIPSSMMCVIAVLVVIHMWGRHETRTDERRRVRPSSSATATLPVSGAEMIARQRPKNRVLALGFAAFVAAAFSSAIAIGVVNNFSGSIGAPIEADEDQIRHAAHHETPTSR